MEKSQVPGEERSSRLPLPLSSDLAVNYSPKLHFLEACAPTAGQGRIGTEIILSLLS